MYRCNMQLTSHTCSTNHSPLDFYRKLRLSKKSFEYMCIYSSRTVIIKIHEILLHTLTH